MRDKLTKNSVRFPHLLQADFLSGLDLEFRRNFIDRCKVQVFTKRTFVLNQGEPSPGMFIIAHGHVEVVYFGHDGERTFLVRLDEGHIIGEVESLADRNCAATCEAGKNTTLLFCPPALLLESMSEFAFVKNVLAVFHTHLLQLNYLKLVDRQGSVEYRLRSYLLMFADRKSKVHDTQTFLGEVVGCSRQSINRELGKLKDLGIISTEKGTIEILDREKLEGLAVTEED